MNHCDLDACPFVCGASAPAKLLRPKPALPRRAPSHLNGEDGLLDPWAQHWFPQCAELQSLCVHGRADRRNWRLAAEVSLRRCCLKFLPSALPAVLCRPSAAESFSCFPNAGAGLPRGPNRRCSFAGCHFASSNGLGLATNVIDPR